MEPPRERFERSIPEQEERMRELLDNFKTETQGKFQEQEQRISQLEETIAEQQNTIGEQNQMIQMIAKHPYLRDFLQGFKTGTLSRKLLGKFKRG